jgi:hypothetical protein
MDFRPHAFVSVSEGFPFWLLGLEPGMVDRIYFPGARNATKLWDLLVINEVPNPLITKAITYLGINKVRFDSNGS